MADTTHALSFDPARLGDDVPRDERLSIVRFWIGPDDVVHSSVRQGTTQYSRSRYWDFGVDVENPSDTAMLLEIRFQTVSPDGFSTQNRSLSVEVLPGERARRWAGFRMSKKEGFKSMVISEIGIRPLRETEWSAVSTPRRSVYEILGMEDVSLPLPVRDVLLFGCVGLVALVFLFMAIIGFTSG